MAAWINGQRLTDLRFADDMALSAESHRVLYSRRERERERERDIYVTYSPAATAPAQRDQWRNYIREAK